MTLLGSSKSTGWVKLKIAMSVTLFGLDFFRERERERGRGEAEEREARTVCVSR